MGEERIRRAFGVEDAEVVVLFEAGSASKAKFPIGLAIAGRSLFQAAHVMMNSRLDNN